MPLLDMTNEELLELYEFVQTMLGGEDIEVDITQREIQIAARKALKNYLYEINQWQTKAQFSNLIGSKASQDFTSKFVTDNTMIAQRISDWFAAMARVGGKVPWKKDYINLEAGRQIYDLSQESSDPYQPGTRRIHRVMWFAQPEYLGTNFTPDLLQSNLFTFGQAGLTFGTHRLSYLGNMFDVVLLLQSLETRNKILFSEFFHNISGDIVELFPMPGSNVQIQPGQKVFYYYFDEADFTDISAQDNGIGELIGNPSQVQINNIPYSKLNAVGKTWIDNYTLALAKYIQASKWRKVRKIATPNSDYEIEFDYASLIEEHKTDIEILTSKLREDLEAMNPLKMFEDKASIAEASAKINRFSPRKIFIG